MFRYLTSGRVFNSRKINGRLGLKENRAVVKVGLNLGNYRFYANYRSRVSKEFSSVALYNAKEQLFRRYFGRSFSISSTDKNKIANRAQLAWKRLSEKRYSSEGVSRLAQAVSLALSRSFWVIPGGLALARGQAAWAQSRSMEVDHYLSQDSLYTHARDGRAYMTSVAYAVVECFIIMVRALYLAILFSPSIMMSPFADSCGPEFRKLWLRVVHRTLEKAGPAFIKWGQWAAARPDLFPKDLCTQLSELHSKAPEHSFAYTRKSIEKAFGRKISEIFDDFEEVPVASGSIAQVHRATLRFRYPGQKQLKPVVVAVKVRHPGVGESIRRDFSILNFVAKISTFVPALNWLRLDESVQQFSVFMMAQVDLAREAAHLSRFLYNFRRWKDVSFPIPLYPLVHPAVLVETYEQGESVSHYLDDEFVADKKMKASLAHIGTRARLKMLLEDNFSHADMHPGNVLVRFTEDKYSLKQAPLKMLMEDNFSHADMQPGSALVWKSSQEQHLESKKSKPHVVFIDVGMTAELSKNDRVNLVDFFRAVARRDGQAAAQCTLNLSQRQNCPNPEAFIEECVESFNFWGTPEGDLIHPSECMEQLLEKVRRHRVNIDGNVCSTIVSFLVLEGWQRKLDPRYDVMQTLQTLLLRNGWEKSLSDTIHELC